MKEMQIVIYADCHENRRGYEGATLELPAAPYEIEDALQRAHVPEDSECRVRIGHEWPRFLWIELVKSQQFSGKKALEELNLLADAVSRMDEIQMGAFEGAIQLHLEETGQEKITLKEMVNLAACLDDYEFHPGVTNDARLGEACMEGGMLDLVERLPDEVAELLDPEKVGASLRQSDRGVFTSAGYAYRGAVVERQEFYDGEHLPACGESHQGMLSLRIEKLDVPEGDDGVWLELPADEKALRWALTSIGEESFDACQITEAKSAVILLQYQLAGGEDIGKLNTLAGRLRDLQQEAPDNLMLMKYKAVLEMEQYPDLDMELDIAANLDCYDYDPEVLSPDSYGEYALQSAGIDTSDPAFYRFDFQGYGERLMEKTGYEFTPYGAVSRNDREFVHEYTEQEEAPGQGMAMEQQ